MRRFFVYVGLLFIAGTASSTEQDSRDCNPFGDATRAVAACGRLIDASRGESTDNIAEVYANRGFAYFRNNNLDQAMSDYDEALRRDSKFAKVYSYRGFWYLVKHDNDRAIVEINKGIRLDPKDAWLRTDRGLAYSLSGKVKLAIADFDAAFELDPKDYVPLLDRGIVRYYNGAPEKARDDFSRAAAIAPKDHMPAIWLDILDRHEGKKSQLATAAQRLDMNRWPAPMVRMFLGELTPEALLSPDQPDLKRNPGLLCDHTFYAAQYNSLTGNKQEADRLFERALQVCPPYYLEGLAVNAVMRAKGRAH